MRIRKHRGSLAESMATMRTLPGITMVLAYLEYHHTELDGFRCELYADQPDSRIGWDETYIITATTPDGTRIPVAFADQHVEFPECPWEDDTARPCWGNVDIICDDADGDALYACKGHAPLWHREDYKPRPAGPKT